MLLYFLLSVTSNVAASNVSKSIWPLLSLPGKHFGWFFLKRRLAINTFDIAHWMFCATCIAMPLQDRLHETLRMLLKHFFLAPSTQFPHPSLFNIMATGTAAHACFKLVLLFPGGLTPEDWSVQKVINKITLTSVYWVAACHKRAPCRGAIRLNVIIVQNNTFTRQFVHIWCANFRPMKSNVTPSQIVNQQQ